MKTYNELNEHEKRQAVKKQLKILTLLLIDGTSKLDDKTKQARIDFIVQNSTHLLVATKKIMNSFLGKELYNMAKIAAEEATYNDLGMQITTGSLTEEFVLFI